MKHALFLVAAAALVATTFGSPVTAAPHGGGGGAGFHGGGGGGFGGGGLGGGSFSAGGLRTIGPASGAMRLGSAPLTRGTVVVQPSIPGTVGVVQPRVGVGASGIARGPGLRYPLGVAGRTRYLPGAVAGTRYAQAVGKNWYYDRRHHRRYFYGGVGFAAAYPYWDNYYYGSCWVQQLGPYGWVWVNTCDPYSSYYY